MSLVTTATRRSWARARHRAATSAVLPEPTGPPMPTRTARGASGRAWWGSSCGCGCVCSTSAGKESYLPCGVVLGGDVEQRRRRGRQVGGGPAGVGRGLPGHLVGLVGEPREQGVHLVRIEAQQPDRRARRAGGRVVRGQQRRLERL